MKKKVLIKENELESLVKNILNEREQLELDLESGENDTLTSLMEEKYKEISNEIKNELEIVKNSGWNEDVYNSLDTIHSDKIFPLWKELDSIENDNPSLSEIVERFNQLEDYLVTCLEIYKEWESLDKQFKDSTEYLMEIVK